MRKAMLGKSENVWIEPPFYFCYGTHIYIGEGSYINFNCNFIDDGIITIGKSVMFGSAVTIASHCFHFFKIGTVRHHLTFSQFSLLLSTTPQTVSFPSAAVNRMSYPANSMPYT